MTHASDVAYGSQTGNTTIRDGILALVGSEGRITAERLAVRLQVPQLNVITSMLSKLEDAGLVRQSGEIVSSITGFNQTLWELGSDRTLIVAKRQRRFVALFDDDEIRPALDDVRLIKELIARPALWARIKTHARKTAE